LKGINFIADDAGDGHGFAPFEKRWRLVEMNTLRVQMVQFVSNAWLDASVGSEVLSARLNKKWKASQSNSFPR
jgi:hypothetical protein